MDINTLLSALRDERNRLETAIGALEGLHVKSKRGPGKHKSGYPPQRKRQHISAAARKRVSAMMKQRWAERKKKAITKTRKSG
jgi:hypothetical protein